MNYLVTTGILIAALVGSVYSYFQLKENPSDPLAEQHAREYLERGKRSGNASPAIRPLLQFEHASYDIAGHLLIRKLKLNLPAPTPPLRIDEVQIHEQIRGTPSRVRIRGIHLSVDHLLALQYTSDGIQERILFTQLQQAAGTSALTFDIELQQKFDTTRHKARFQLTAALRTLITAKADLSVENFHYPEDARAAGKGNTLPLGIRLERLDVVVDGSNLVRQVRKNMSREFFSLIAEGVKQQAQKAPLRLEREFFHALHRVLNGTRTLHVRVTPRPTLTLTEIFALRPNDAQQRLGITVKTQ